MRVTGGSEDGDAVFHSGNCKAARGVEEQTRKVSFMMDKQRYKTLLNFPLALGYADHD